MQALTYSAPRKPAAASSTPTPQPGMELGPAILSLPEKQRVILCLHYFEQLELDQIAEVLGTSEQQMSAEFQGAVEQLNRARRGSSRLVAA